MEDKNRLRLFVIYTIINTSIVIASLYGIGDLNDDIGYGMFASWIIAFLIEMFTLS